MNFDGSGLRFSFGRWCCTQVEFYTLNGTSIMKSVVVRNGGLRLGILLQNYHVSSGDSPLTSALQGPRQANLCDFEVSLVCIVSSRLASEYTERHYLKK